MSAVTRIAGGAARAVRALAAVAAVAAVIVSAFVFRDGVPDAFGGWVVAFLVIALVAWPAVVLFLLAAALRALARLPEQLRSTPSDVAARAAELRDVAERVRAVRGARLVRLPWLLIRFARVAGSSRELLTPHVAVLPLVSLPFLALAAAAVPAALLVIATSAVLAIVLALS